MLNSVEEQHEERRAGWVELTSWCLMGTSGWWSLNVIAAELPIFIVELPERELIGNLVAVCTQLGNVFPIVYKLTCCQGSGNVTLIICVFQCIATLSLVLCALFWRVQIYGHSAVLLLCTVLAGGVGCMSSVTYWASAAWHPAGCTQAMSVGMTFGGLLAIGVSSLQLFSRHHSEPRFSVWAYFCLAAGLQALMCFLFVFQACSTARRREHEESLIMSSHGVPERSHRTASQSVLSLHSSTVSEDPHDAEETPHAVPEHSAGPREVVEEPAGGARPKVAIVPLASKVLIVSSFCIYGATYAMPTLMPFSIAAFGENREKQQLLLRMLIFQYAGDVLGRLATFCGRAAKPQLFVWTLVLVTTFGSMCFFSGWQTWIPKVVGYDASLWFLPAVCGVYFFSRGLMVTSLYLYARMLGTKSFSSNLSSDMGFFGQMGALGANAVTFVLANWFGVFNTSR